MEPIKKPMAHTRSFPMGSLWVWEWESQTILGPCVCNAKDARYIIKVGNALEDAPLGKIRCIILGSIQRNLTIIQNVIHLNLVDYMTLESIVMCTWDTTKLVQNQLAECVKEPNVTSFIKVGQSKNIANVLTILQNFSSCITQQRNIFINVHHWIDLLYKPQLRELYQLCK